MGNAAWRRRERDVQWVDLEAFSGDRERALAYMEEELRKNLLVLE